MCWPMEVVVVVVAFCACVVLAVDIVYVVLSQMVEEAWIVSYNVYWSASHGILIEKECDRVFIFLCSRM